MSSFEGLDAFTFVTVAYDLPERIDAVCPWKDRVYVGLADGSMVVLQPEFELHEDGPWDIERHVKGIGKKSISHLEPAASLSALFVLSQSGIQLYSLPELESIAQVHSGSVNAFRLIHSIQVPVSGGVPFRFAWNDEKSCLCVAVRRSLIFYTLEETQFIETNTVVIPDTLKVMAWCGDVICYGMRIQLQ